MTAETPLLAAVVLLHRRHDGELEIFWTKRADRLAFLGGFWAFPGGRVEPEDAAVDVPGARGDRAAVIAAAARELEEETGVRVVPDAQRFVFAGRTVTPPGAPLRFDATYFLVEAPPGAAPDVARSGGELVAGEWIRPAEALASFWRSERLLSHVVFGTLEALELGLAGAAERMAARLPVRASERLFQLLPGIAIAPVRTPTLPPATHTNCYVVGGAEVVVIDPASPYADEQQALARALDEALAGGRRVREIWLTHHHADHASGAADLAQRLGVPIAAHARTAALLAGRVPVSRHLVDGEVAELPAGGRVPLRRLRALFTPGHAPGHLCFHEETTGVLITGDMVAGIGTIIIDPDEGDMAEYLTSLELMKRVAPAALLPAHGPVIVAARAKLDEYTAHRLARETAVMAALSARPEASAAELVPDVYRDVAPALHGLAERSLLAHLRKLVKDGRATAREGERFTATG